MKNFSTVLLRAGFAVLATYVVMGGATGAGLLVPAYRTLTLIMLSGIVLLWLIGRYRGHWQWRQSPYDIPFVLWLAVVLLSLFANLDAWPRIAIGLWFTLVYAGLWYILWDMIGNRALKSAILLESLMVAGIIVMAFGYLQVLTFIKAGLPVSRYAIMSTLDNPDILAGFLVIVLTLALTFAFRSRQNWLKVLLGLYAILAALLLVITDSRGGWVGALAALVTLLVLLLNDREMLNRRNLKQWWTAQSPARKALALALSSIAIMGAILAIIYIASLSNSPGRTLDLRTYLYNAAFNLFKEKPILGSGLFTFGRGLMRWSSVPPEAAQAHAHDVILDIAAELGLAGLCALTVLVVAVVRAVRNNWRDTHNRTLLLAAIPGLVGMAFQHLFDMPSLTSPALFLAGLLLLVVATAPTPDVAQQAKPRRLTSLICLPIWALLLFTAFRSIQAYDIYFSALRAGSAPEATVRLQKAIAADASNPVYYFYQGLYSELAFENNPANLEFRQQAISAYEHFLTIEPYYAPALTDLAVLRWETGQPQAALAVLKKAYDLAPQSWPIAYLYGTYREQLGDLTVAHEAYQRALTLNPDSSLIPEWTQSAIRRSMPNSQLSTMGQIVTALGAGATADVRRLWQQTTAQDRATSKGHVVAEMIALTSGDRVTAQQELAQIPGDPGDYWYQIGRWAMAHFNSDAATANEALAKAQQLVSTSADEGDVNRVSGIAYLQYLVIGLDQYFLPQVYDPGADPVAAYLVDWASKQTGSPTVI
ncbi:MAG TPA: O-antigen ligase family protein [Aggregatilineales bacterium]|nr:O-antigen ligase family protein [Aggregatilineales bacterium]